AGLLRSLAHERRQHAGRLGLPHGHPRSHRNRRIARHRDAPPVDAHGPSAPAQSAPAQRPVLRAGRPAVVARARAALRRRRPPQLVVAQYRFQPADLLMMRTLLAVLVLALAGPAAAHAAIRVDPTGVNVNTQGATTVFLTFGGLADQRPAEALWCGELIPATPDIGFKCDPATIFGSLPLRFDRSSVR